VLYSDLRKSQAELLAKPDPVKQDQHRATAAGGAILSNHLQQHRVAPTGDTILPHGHQHRVVATGGAILSERGQQYPVVATGGAILSERGQQQYFTGGGDVTDPLHSKLPPDELHSRLGGEERLGASAASLDSNKTIKNEENERAAAREKQLPDFENDEWCHFLDTQVSHRCVFSG
jgi:hypothetical protein